MTRTVTATFDGEVLRPDEPVDLEPNTRVRITIEAFPKSSVRVQSPEPVAEKTLSFLDIAASLNLEGPSDWSEMIGNGGYRLPERDLVKTPEDRES